MYMQNSLIDIDKVNSYVNENSKKGLKFVFFVLGIILGTFSPVLDFEFESIKNGLLLGFVIGLFWIAFRYKKFGESGVMKTQNEMAVVIVYMFYFFLGVVGGYYLVRPLVNSIGSIIR